MKNKYILFVYLILMTLLANGCASSSYHFAPTASYHVAELSGFENVWKLESVFIGYDRLNPKIVASKGAVVFIGGLDIDKNNLIALDATTGELLWQRIDSPGVISAQSNKVLVGWDGGATVKRLELKTGTTLWETKLPNRSVVYITVENDSASVQTSGGKDIFFVLDTNTGEIIFEEENSQSDIYLYAKKTSYQRGISPSVLESINNNESKIIWQAEMDYRYSFPPLFTETTILVTTDLGNVYCIDRQTGRVIWQKEGIAMSNFAVSNKAVYFLTNDEKLVEIDLQSGEQSRFVEFGVKRSVSKDASYISSYRVVYDAETETIFVQFGDSAQLFAFNAIDSK